MRRIRVSRRLDGPGLHHHLQLVLGAREQLDGSGLAEPGPVHLVEDRTLVGLDPERDGELDELRDVVHVAPLQKTGGRMRVKMRGEEPGGST